MADYKDIIAGTFSALAEKAKKVANTVAESVGENGSVRGVYEAGAGRAKAYARMAKLSLELNGENEELKRVYTEIGKLFYEQNAAAPDGIFAALFSQVEEINRRIADKNTEISAIKADMAPAEEERDIDVEIEEFDDIVSAAEEENKTEE